MIFFVLLIILSSSTYALTEKLSVQSCTYAGCTAAGWNDLDSSPDGSTVAALGSDTLTMSNQTFADTATINSITVRYSHGAEAGIKGNTNIMFKSAGGTTYCTSSIANSASYRYDTVTPSGCGWTAARLRDLLITFTNGDTKKAIYNDFINFTIDYTPYSDSTPPTVTLGLPGNDTWKTANPITFYFTPTDTQSTISNCTLILNNNKNVTKTPITNGSENSLQSTLADGLYWWTINCTDSWNMTGTATPKKYLKVDTKGPKVNLETPADNDSWTSSQTVDFKFNATDNMTTLLSCELIIDKSIKDTKSSPAEGTTLTFSYAPGNGQHNWSVNCTDSNNFETSSAIRNITVNYAGRTVITDYGTYEQGSNASITGSNWADGTVTMIIKMVNGTTVSWNTSASAGAISTYYYINYSYPIGQYNITAFEYADPANNATAAFTVTERIAALNLISSYFKQGESIQINGSGFSPDNTVTLNIVWVGGSNITTQNSDSQGRFTFSFQTNYTSWTGKYNITAIDDMYQNLNASGNFTLKPRIPALSLPKYSFGINEMIDLLGYNFSIYGGLSITLFENTTKTLAPSYPRSESADYNGDFIHSWNTTDTCPGVYGFTVEDQNYTSYNKTIYFNLTGSSLDYTSRPNQTSGFNPGTASNLWYEADSNIESLALTTTHTILIRLNNSIDPGATISTATFYIDHAMDQPARGQFNTIEWQNGTNWVIVCTYNKALQTYMTQDTCDLFGVLKNGSQASDVTIRASYTRTGGPVTTNVDYARLDITAGGSATCTNWGNKEPTIATMVLDDGYSVPAGEIDLKVGQLTSVICNITASDQDGYDNIKNASATLYYYMNKSNDPDNNLTHYTNPDCTNAGNNGIYDKYFSCVFNVTYYANNGTWYCNVTVYDNSSNRVSGEVSVTINPLYALNVSAALDFGDIQIGSESPDNNLTIYNFGNQEIDVGLDAYGVVDGDGISMDCTTANLTMDNLRYSLSYGTGFGSMTPISDTMVVLSGFNLAKQNSSTSSKKDVYWKVNIAPPAYGVCTGTLIVTAMNT